LISKKLPVIIVVIEKHIVQIAALRWDYWQTIDYQILYPLFWWSLLQLCFLTEKS